MINGAAGNFFGFATRVMCENKNDQIIWLLNEGNKTQDIRVEGL